MQKASLVRGGFLPTPGESDPGVEGERKKVNQHSPVERAFHFSIFNIFVIFFTELSHFA